MRGRWLGLVPVAGLYDCRGNAQSDGIAASDNHASFQCTRSARVCRDCRRPVVLLVCTKQLPATVSVPTSAAFARTNEIITATTGPIQLPVSRERSDCALVPVDGFSVPDAQHRFAVSLLHVLTWTPHSPSACSPVPSRRSPVGEGASFWRLLRARRRWPVQPWSH